MRSVIKIFFPFIKSFSKGVIWYFWSKSVICDILRRHLLQSDHRTHFRNWALERIQSLLLIPQFSQYCGNLGNNQDFSSEIWKRVSMWTSLTISSYRPRRQSCLTFAGSQSKCSIYIYSCRWLVVAESKARLTSRSFSRCI